MTRFHLVRHASTDAVGQVLSGRGSATSLNAEGQAQASLLAQALLQLPIARVFSSPQLRAIETAGCIAQSLGLQAEIEPAIDEVDFGAWTGESFEVLDQRPAWRLWNAHRGLAACPDGESMLAVQARIVAFVQRVHAQAAGDVVLVSHADVLKSLLAYMLCLPLELLRRIEIASASHSIIAFNCGDVRIDSMNRTYTAGQNA